MTIYGNANLTKLLGELPTMSMITNILELATKNIPL
jgi:hypothetical protein